MIRWNYSTDLLQLVSLNAFRLFNGSVNLVSGMVNREWWMGNGEWWINVGYLSFCTFCSTLMKKYKWVTQRCLI